MGAQFLVTKPLPSTYLLRANKCWVLNVVAKFCSSLDKLGTSKF